MEPVRVLGDRDTVLAFTLGGVPGRVVQTADEARAAVDAAVREVRDGGGSVHRPLLLLITEPTAERIRDYLDHLVLQANGPLVLEIPGFGAGKGQRQAERFVRRVLGISP